MTPITPLPAEFAFLAGLAGEPTLERAQALTRTSKDVAPLRSWLAEQRRRTVRGLLTSKAADRATLAETMGVAKQTVTVVSCAKPREVELPGRFAALAHLAGEPTLEQAAEVTRTALAARPLLAWLRDERQRTVRALLDGPYDRAEIGTALGVSVQRVSDIAAGHRGPWARGQARGGS
ncbi:hypothetical protein [Streptomyces sp. DH8]|uniref:hypothetical protein n=1 Tax=Streptomyces sp. DH8 TaxID=2857008 RepID=UPI001E3E8478|nr:hypothetical protein [Streptomyces sp. DH8]